MKREIKFRGRRITGVWAFGDLAEKEKEYVNGQWKRQFAIALPQNGFAVKVDSDTVGQFTGLLDVNGKEIYEGDILKEWEKGNTRYGDWERILGSVVYEKKSIGANTYIGWYTMCPEDGFYSHLNTHSLYKIEVIGNIHDNPELLKQ
jgi:uncharacterized phage protein (TIGR01671 family)